MLFEGKFIWYKYNWNRLVIFIFWLFNGLFISLFVCNVRLFIEGMIFFNIDESVWWVRLNICNFFCFRLKVGIGYLGKKEVIFFFLVLLVV